MILYHFTRPEYLPAILREGLKPPQGFDTELGYDRNARWRNAVWLTTRPTRQIPEQHMALIRERLPDLDNQEWLPGASARLQVRIPSHDRKLFQYISWLQKNPWQGCPNVGDEIVQIGMKDFWIYFGIISPDRLLLA